MATKPAKKTAAKTRPKTTAKEPRPTPAERLEAFDKVVASPDPVATDDKIVAGWNAAPKVCRLWHVSGAGYKNRRVEAVDADGAVREFCAVNMTGGNLAEIGNGIVNANRSVDYVATVNGTPHLLTVEEVK